MLLPNSRYVYFWCCIKIWLPLQCRHISVMASQVIGNSTVSLIDYPWKISKPRIKKYWPFPLSGGFPSQWANYAERIFISWRHPDLLFIIPDHISTISANGKWHKTLAFHVFCHCIWRCVHNGSRRTKLNVVWHVISTLFRDKRYLRKVVFLPIFIFYFVAARGH